MKLEEKTIFRQLFCLTTHQVISSCGACCIRNGGQTTKSSSSAKKYSKVHLRLIWDFVSQIKEVFSRFTGSLAPLQTAAVSYHLQTNFGVYFCTEWGQTVDFVPLRKHWSEDERSQQAKPVSVYTRGAWLLFKDTLEKTVNPSRQSAAVILTAAALLVRTAEEAERENDETWPSVVDENRIDSSSTSPASLNQQRKTNIPQSCLFSKPLFISAWTECHDHNISCFFHPFYIISSQLPLKK